MNKKSNNVFELHRLSFTASSRLRNLQKRILKNAIEQSDSEFEQHYVVVIACLELIQQKFVRQLTFPPHSLQHRPDQHNELPSTLQHIRLKTLSSHEVNLLKQFKQTMILLQVFLLQAQQGGRYPFFCLAASVLVAQLFVRQQNEDICLNKSCFALEVICLLHFLIDTYNLLVISHLAISRHKEKIGPWQQFYYLFCRMNYRLQVFYPSQGKAIEYFKQEMVCQKFMSFYSYKQFLGPLMTLKCSSVIFQKVSHFGINNILYDFCVFYYSDRAIQNKLVYCRQSQGLQCQVCTFLLHFIKKSQRYIRQEQDHLQKYRKKFSGLMLYQEHILYNIDQFTNTQHHLDAKTEKKSERSGQQRQVFLLNRLSNNHISNLSRTILYYSPASSCFFKNSQASQLYFLTLLSTTQINPTNCFPYQILFYLKLCLSMKQICWKSSKSPLDYFKSYSFKFIKQFHTYSYDRLQEQQSFISLYVSIRSSVAWMNLALQVNNFAFFILLQIFTTLLCLPNLQYAERQRKLVEGSILDFSIISKKNSIKGLLFSTNISNMKNILLFALILFNFRPLLSSIQAALKL